jgi:diphthine synthase
MTVAECAGQMVEVEGRRGEGVCGAGRLAVGMARVGGEDQAVKAGTLAELAECDLGAPLHSVVLLGRLTYELEWEFLREFAINGKTFDKAWEEGGYEKA